MIMKTSWPLSDFSKVEIGLKHKIMKKKIDTLKNI